MARIRSLKPEFWDSPSTAKADLAVRLTFMALWNWADDSGRGTANVKELEAFCFPNDNVQDLPRKSRGNSAPTAGSWRNFAEVLGEVAEAYGVRFYRVHGRPYYVIPSFKSHQSKDFRQKSKYPTEEHGEFYDVTSGNATASQGPGQDETTPSATPAGNSATYAGKTPLVTGEQGNRGTGDKHPCSSDDEPADEPSPYPQAFEEWWATYPRKQAKRKALNEWRRATKRINRDTLINRTQQFATFHERENTDKQFIPLATTWLARDGWDDELIPRRLTNEQPQPTRNAWLPTQPDIIDAQIIPDHQWQSKGELPW